MSSNAATSRLLSRLPPATRLVQVADDVYCVHPDDVSAVRGTLASQPQIGYFLDRQVVMDKYIINTAGEGVYVMRKKSSVPVYPTLLQYAKRIVHSVTYGQSSAVVPGYAGTESTYHTWTAVHPQNPDNTLYVVGGMKHVHYKAVFGAYEVGDTTEVNCSKTPSPAEVNALDSTHPERWGGYSGTYEQVMEQLAGANISAHTVHVSPSAAVSIVRTPRPTNGFTGYPMIAGPASASFGEFYGGLEWTIGSYSEVAARLKVVIAHMKTKDSKIDVSKFNEAAEDMLASTDKYLIAFKGSPAFDPIDMWPFVQSVAKKMSEVPVDGSVITTQSLSEGAASWNSGKWCLTATGGSTTATALETTISSSASASTITLKASGNGSAHLNDGHGTVDVDFDVLIEAVRSYRRAGKTIEVLPSDFTLNPSFQRDKWDLIVSATTSTPSALPAASVDLLGDHGGFGEAVCTRLLTKPQFDVKEEYLILPYLTPQYFWTNLARPDPALNA